MESASCKYISLAINCSCFSFGPLRDLLLMCEDTPIWCPISSHIPSNCSQLPTSLTEVQCGPHLGGGPWEEACASPGSGIEVPDSQKTVKKKRTWVLGGYIYLALWTPGSMKSNAVQSDPGPQSSDLCPRSLFLSPRVASESWKQSIYTSPGTFFSFGIELSFLAGK